MSLASELGSPDGSNPSISNLTHSLALAWAKRYVRGLNEQNVPTGIKTAVNRREAIAQRLREVLRPVSAKAWTQTEALLAQEINRHGIDPQLIDPWGISKDAFDIYDKALQAYAQKISPPKFSAWVSSDLGRIRTKNTAIDPRVIGFVSLQFHYSGQILLRFVPPPEQVALNSYFKVIDDHLYMPLQRAYAAAGNHTLNSPALQAVQQLLPQASAIARKIVDRVIQVYPTYRCYSGPLKHPKVQISSLRDVEMFQVYLWVCLLEDSVSALQEELFPLCVMLYPTLKVRWELVRQMIHLLGVEVRACLNPEQAALYNKYYQALWAMFSPEVFPELEN